MKNAAGNNVPAFRLRSVDGTSVWIAGDSIIDYVLHPVFLRFLTLVILLYALLDQRPALAGLGGWEQGLLWLVIGSSALLWLAICAQVSRNLMKKGFIRSVYTPVILLPMVIGLQVAIGGITGLLGTSLAEPATLEYLARDLLVAGVIDLFHGSFVSHAHPLGRAALPVANESDVPPDEMPVPAESVEDAGTEPPVAQPRDGVAAQEGLMVQIGPALLPFASILLIRTEDHYLGVTTRTGKALHRAKMADIAELHASALGMQINRSVWIAYSAVKEIVEAENRQVVVTLVTGDEERVARPRLFAFRQNYAKYVTSRAG